MSAPFALFVEDQYGPLFRQSMDDLEEAARRAQQLADEEGFPFFVFSFADARRLGRFEPRSAKSAGA